MSVLVGPWKPPARSIDKPLGEMLVGDWIMTRWEGQWQCWVVEDERQDFGGAVGECVRAYPLMQPDGSWLDGLSRSKQWVPLSQIEHVWDMQIGTVAVKEEGS